MRKINFLPCFCLLTRRAGKTGLVLPAILLLLCHIDTNDAVAQENPISTGVFYTLHHSITKFNTVTLSYANEYASEPDVKTSPNYIHYPYPPRNVLLYGPTLNVTITDGNELNDGLITKYSSLRITRDSAPAKYFNLAELKVRIVKNQKTLVDWKNVKLFPKVSDQSPSNQAKKSIRIFNDTIEIHDRITIELKTGTESLARFNFERHDPFYAMPFVTSYSRDTTDQPYQRFIEAQLRQHISRSDHFDQFYRYWPYQGNVLKNTLAKDRLYADSRIALRFRNPLPGIDTTLEYALLTGKREDTSWQTTGHLLLIGNLRPGLDYRLLVRYKNTPYVVETLSFTTLPKWYQSSTFKYTVVLAGILLLLATVFLYHRLNLRKEKRKQHTLQLELRSLRAQLNPHFIFNSLASIQALINKNDIISANHYLSEFSILLRESLVNNSKELIPLGTEVKLLDTYLKLEQLRFRFQYDISIDESLDKNLVELPSLLLQPLAENAVKHGMAGLNENGKIDIRFTKQDDRLQVFITDNGKGFSERNATAGFGLKLTRDRIELLNQSMQGQFITLNITGKQNEGTLVHLSFKNWL